MKYFLAVVIAFLAAVIAIPPLYYAVFPYPAAPTLPPPGQRVILPGGIGVNVIEQGEGPPVVLSHGLPGSAYDWRALLPAIADRGYRAIAYGRVGYGRSDPRPNADYTPAANAQELNELLKALHLEDVTVVGWSYGGVVAMLAALEEISPIARLVLLGTAGPDSQDTEPPEPPFIMTLMNSEPVLRWQWAVPPMGVALMEAGSHMAFSGGPQPAWWLEGLRANFGRWDTLAAYSGEIRGVSGASINAKFEPASILQPVLILHGDDDQAAPVEIGRYLNSVIPRSELIEIKGGSHMLPVTHTKEIAERITAFAGSRSD